MLAADTSVWIDFAKGTENSAVLMLQEGLQQGWLVMPPLVLVEVLSGPRITAAAEEFIHALPRLDLTPGYWERTAVMRRGILKKGLKARLGDCLIAQSCIDQNVPLITGDSDFRHFVRYGLRLMG